MYGWGRGMRSVSKFPSEPGRPGPGFRPMAFGETGARTPQLTSDRECRVRLQSPDLARSQTIDSTISSAETAVPIGRYHGVATASASTPTPAYGAPHARAAAALSHSRPKATNTDFISPLRG